MTRRSSYSKALKALALMVQRLNTRLPDMIRGPLRSLLISLVKVETVDQGIEDWSTPLIAGRGVEVDLAASANEVRISESDGAPLEVANLLASTELANRSTSSGEPKPRLRCLLATSDFDAGGMDEVVFFLASRLPDHEIHTAVLHASDEGSPDGVPTGRLGRQLRDLGIETVELAADTGVYWLEAWQPEVISAHGAPTWVLDTATRLSIPYIDTLHGTHWHFHAGTAAEIERGHRISGIVAVSDLVRQQYLQGNSAFPPERIVTIPNGVDDWRRVPGDRGQARALLGIRDEYLFVSLARHCLQKNTYGLVAAFADVAARHPEAHLVIVGRIDDTAYFAQVQSLRLRLDCSDRIHLRDHVSNPAELLAAADGFVLDSFFEGWSLASMEALHAGVPVVLSEVGGAREQVGEGKKRGYVVPNPLGDPLRVDWETMRKTRFKHQTNREALVEAMSSLITNRDFWLYDRQKLIEESAVQFNPDVCLQKHAKVLTAAVHRKPLTGAGILERKLAE